MDVDFETIDEMNGEFLIDNIGYVKWYVMVSNKWKPTDPLIHNITFAQWIFYYLVMKRKEIIDHNKMRQLFELNSFINNPQVFQEYYKNTYNKEDQTQTMQMKMDELGMDSVFYDEETDMTLTKSEIDEIIGKIPGFLNSKEE